MSAKILVLSKAGVERNATSRAKGHSDALPGQMLQGYGFQDVFRSRINSSKFRSLASKPASVSLPQNSS